MVKLHLPNHLTGKPEPHNLCTPMVAIADPIATIAKSFNRRPHRRRHN